MGASASVQKEEQSRKVSRRNVTAQNVRKRLHDEFGREEEVEGNQDGNKGLGMAEVPVLLKAKNAFMKSIKREDVGRDDGNIVKKQDNHALLKEMFHRIDPLSVSGSYGKVLGEIEVSMKYKSNECTLLVKIGRAKNLQCPDVHKLPNPFVHAQLIVKRLGEQAAQMQKTRQKADTANPLFQEILTFDLIQADLVDAKLRIGVWNKDSVSHNDFLGEAVLELYKEEVNGGVAVWHKLKPRIDLDVTGKVELTLQYDDSKVYVNLHQATDLKIADSSSNTSNPYVRCYVTGVANREETMVVAENLDPVFEESFEYEVFPEDLHQRVLVLNVLSKETTGKDTRLGDVHIPLREIDFERPQKCWYELADLSNTPHTRNKWSEEGLSQEFKEAMRAHAIYQYPHCLFKGKHSGRKATTRAHIFQKRRPTTGDLANTERQKCCRNLMVFQIMEADLPRKESPIIWDQLVGLLRSWLLCRVDRTNAYKVIAFCCKYFHC